MKVSLTQEDIKVFNYHNHHTKLQWKSIKEKMKALVINLSQQNMNHKHHKNNLNQ